MRTRILVGMMAVGAMLLGGCCQLFQINCPPTPDGFTLSMHNGLTTCGGPNGQFNLEYKWEYTDVNGNTATGNTTTALNDTDETPIHTVQDADFDGKADHFKISVDRSCSPQVPLWQDFTFDNKIPLGGTLAGSVDQTGKVTFSIKGPQDSTSQATSAIKQVFGIKDSSSKSCCGR